MVVVSAITRSLVNVSVVIALFSATTACARKPVYDWGSYNPAIARLYSGDPNYDVDGDIEALATEIEQTPLHRIPPGKAAHLGFLYALKGMHPQARQFFEMEKRLFPESSTLMNRLIAKTK